MNFILDPSLVLYLPLYQLEGASFMSKDAHGHLCSVTGALWRPDGRYFDGIDDKVNCGSSDVFDFTSEFTLAVWVKLGAIAKTKHVITNRDVANKAGWTLFHYTDNKFYIQGGDGVTWGSLGASTANTYTDTGKFYWLVVTFDGTGRIYVDNVADGTDTSNPLGASGNAALIGGDTYDGNSPFEGEMGDVFAFNRALTSQEIQRIYLATKWRYQ